MRHDRLVRAFAGAAGVLALTAGAGAQNGWFFEVAYSNPEGVIASLEDTATVSLWAAFDPVYYAFQAGALDVAAADIMGAGVWTDPQTLLTGPKSSDGIIIGDTVAGIVALQLFLELGGVFPDTSNPIKVWTATWQTPEIRMRTIPLTTETLYFGVFPSDVYGYSKEITDTIVEGFGEIVVVPAPGFWLVASAMMALRRRR